MSAPESKPGRVETVAVDLDAITDPIPISCQTFQGAHMIPCGRSMGDAATMGIKVLRWGGIKSGNQRTARWRNRHGGAWVSPVNGKFKV